MTTPAPPLAGAQQRGQCAGHVWTKNKTPQRPEELLELEQVQSFTVSKHIWEKEGEECKGGGEHKEAPPTHYESALLIQCLAGVQFHSIKPGEKKSFRTVKF